MGFEIVCDLSKLLDCPVHGFVGCLCDLLSALGVFVGIGNYVGRLLRRWRRLGFRLIRRMFPDIFLVPVAERRHLRFGFLLQEIFERLLLRVWSKAKVYKRRFPSRGLEE